MLIQVPVYSSRPFSFQRLSALLGVDDLVLVSSPNETPDAWFFYRRKHAVTMFMIEKTEDAYVLSMDRLASYDDYRFLPYLVDTLTFLLTGILTGVTMEKMHSACSTKNGPLRLWERKWHF